MIIDLDYNQLTEVFAVPIGLKPVAKVGSEIFYGSDKLNKNFLKALSKSNKTKSLIDKFDELIQRKKLNPVFLEKGIYRLIKWKIFAPSNMKSQVGFYDSGKTKAVYITLSNNTNIFAYVSNNFMAELTIHECIHMVASLKSVSSFMSLFKIPLIEYYKSLWSIYFKFDKSKIKNEVVFNISKYLLENIDKKFATNSTYVKYYNMLQETILPLTLLNEKQFSKILLDYILFAKLYTMNLKAFFNSRNKYQHVSTALYQAYKDAFGFVNYTTTVVQEIIYPSEIIAILSEEKIDSKIKSAIKMI